LYIAFFTTVKKNNFTKSNPPFNVIILGYLKTAHPSATSGAGRKRGPVVYASKPELEGSLWSAAIQKGNTHASKPAL